MTRLDVIGSHFTNDVQYDPFWMLLAHISQIMYNMTRLDVIGSHFTNNVQYDPFWMFSSAICGEMFELHIATF